MKYKDLQHAMFVKAHDLVPCKFFTLQQLADGNRHRDIDSYTQPDHAEHYAKRGSTKPYMLIGHLYEYAIEDLISKKYPVPEGVTFQMMGPGWYGYGTIMVVYSRK